MTIRYSLKTVCLLVLIPSSATATEHRSNVLVTTQFAVPVGVPVAPFAPTYYSLQATRPVTQATTLSKSQEDALVQRIARRVAQELRTGSVKQLETTPPALAINLVAIGVLKQRCVTCHNQENAKGKLNLDVDLADMSRQVRQKSLLRVLSTDPSRRMPKGQPPLSESEFLALFRELVH